MCVSGFRIADTFHWPLIRTDWRTVCGTIHTHTHSTIQIKMFAVIYQKIETSKIVAKQMEESLCEFHIYEVKINIIACFKGARKRPMYAKLSSAFILIIDIYRFAMQEMPQRHFLPFKYDF